MNTLPFLTSPEKTKEVLTNLGPIPIDWNGFRTKPSDLNQLTPSNNMDRSNLIPHSFGREETDKPKFLIICDPIGDDQELYPRQVFTWDEETQQYIPVPEKDSLNWMTVDEIVKEYGDYLTQEDIDKISPGHD